MLALAVIVIAAGLHAASGNECMLLKVMGATRLQTHLHRNPPSGLPHLFSGQARFGASARR